MLSFPAATPGKSSIRASASAPVRLEAKAERSEDLARRRGMEHRDGARCVVGREHAAVKVCRIALVGQVGDVQRQLRPLHRTDITELVAKAEIERDISL